VTIVDAVEAKRIEDEIREEARRVALALADYPEYARDVRDSLTREIGIESRQELDDFYPIGGADDMQADSESFEHRRMRRLAELKLALDEIRTS
jgi:hypothetical protein